MPPWLTLAAIKDLIVIAAVAFLAWWVYHSGQNSVHVHDLKQIQQQLVNMQAEGQRWQKEQSNAQAQLNADIPKINSLADDTARQHIWMCDNRPAQQPVPLSAAPAPGSPPAGPRGADARPQRDIAPAIAALERKYETALEECRQALAAWPH